MKTRVSTADLYDIISVGDPQISPSGDHALFTEMRMNEEKNSYESDIYLIDDLDQTRPLTQDGASSMGRWDASGDRFCYLAKNGGKTQLYIYTMATGKSAQLMVFEGDVSYPAWSPDDKKIAFIGTITEETDPLAPMIVNTLKIKSNEESGFIDTSKKRQIYVVDLETQGVIQVTPDDFHLYHPEWHHVTTPQWSPDGTRLAFVSQVQDEIDRDANPYKGDVYVVASTGGIPKAIHKKAGPAIKPTWNQAGTAILFIGSNNEYYRTTILKLLSHDLETETTEVLTDHFDRCLEDFIVGDTKGVYSDTYVKESADGEFLYFLASNQGSTNVYRLSLKTGCVAKVVGGKRRIYGFDLCKATNTLVFAYETSTNPGEIGRYHLDSMKEEKLTRVNAFFDTNRLMSVPESFTYMSADGMEQEGFIMKPIGYKEGVKYPCVLEIHGGPYYQYGYSMMFEFQLLAARGYAVIYCNPRGSRGYGQALSFAQINNYGTRDYEDIMIFVDQAIKLGFIDTDRMGVTGGSYGGYMTNWIACHTDIFKAGVTQRCISNLVSKYSTCDTGYFSVEQMFTGVKEPNFDRMWEISPLKYVKNIKMPLLIIHSEKDMRCPISQGEELYTALKMQGNETTMIRFPESNHGLSRGGIPSLRLFRLKSILDYFDAHIEKDESDYAIV